jgi:hypothetical protein
LSEDFLSPVFAGLGFRDVFSFVGALAGNDHPDLWADRGRRMEQAWVRAYDKFVSGPNAGSKKGAIPTGLGAPFTSIVPEDRDGVAWRPLLLLNGTSVETGRRIIASHLFSTYLSDLGSGGATLARVYARSEPCIRLFTDAYDLHELLNGALKEDQSSCKGSRLTNATLLDLTLAGAANNSARFPVVSPAGNLVPKDTTVGRVVDGGYFDNYGALTAFDLADTLRWEYNLYPFVLLITNDPSDNRYVPSPGAPVVPWFSSPPNTIAAERELFASVATAPVDTVLATRSGHGSTALQLLRGIIDPVVYQRRPIGEKKDTQDTVGATQDLTCFGLASSREDAEKNQSVTRPEPCFAHLGVFSQITWAGTVKDVSMSWWLSKPVQSYIDDQFADQRNLHELDLVCAVLSRGSDSGSAADLGRERFCRNQIRQLAHAPALPG